MRSHRRTGPDPARSRRSFSARNARWISVDDETFSCISDIGAPDSAAACTRAATDRPTWSATLRTSSRRLSSDNSPNVGSDGSYHAHPPQPPPASPIATARRTGTTVPDTVSVSTTVARQLDAPARAHQRRPRPRPRPTVHAPADQPGADRVLRQHAEQLAADRVDELAAGRTGGTPTTTSPTRRCELAASLSITSAARSTRATVAPADVGA